MTYPHLNRKLAGMVPALSGRSRVQKIFAYLISSYTIFPLLGNELFSSYINLTFIQKVELFTKRKKHIYHDHLNGFFLSLRCMVFYMDQCNSSRCMCDKRVLSWHRNLLH